MNLTFFLLACFFLFGMRIPVLAQLHPSDDIDLKGSVKFLHSTHYAVKKNKNGEIKKEGVLDGGEAYSLIVYDPDGLPLERYLGNLSQQKDSTWKASRGMIKYIYDNESRQLKGSLYKLRGEQYNSIAYSYDDAGRRIGEIYDDAYDKTDAQCVFQYDEKKRVTVRNCNRPDGTFGSKTIQRFDEKGNQIEYSLFMEGCCVDSKIVIKYDAQNTLIEERVFNNEDQFRYSMTYEYQYDEKGNWIQRLEYVDGKLMYLTERKLEYYD